MSNVIFFNKKDKIKISPEKVETVEWRRKKIINPETGKEVYEDSKIGRSIKETEKYRLRMSCPPGYRYDPRKGKCVKRIEDKTSPKKKRKTIKECPTGYIVNPLTNRCVKIDSEAGKRALKINYEKIFW